MNRLIALTSAFLLAALLSGGAALAQVSHRVEILAGAEFPLNSSEFDVDNSTGLVAGVGVRLTPRFILGVQYDSISTTDDIGRNGDVDLTFFGLTSTVYFNDDPALQLLGIVSAGMGELEFVNPLPPNPALLDSTDIDLWYEGAVAAQFTAGQRWLFRLKIGARQVRPEMPSLLLQRTRTMLLPSFTIGIKF